MKDVQIERGVAKVAAGTWLVGRGQPLAYGGAPLRLTSLRGFFVADRQKVQVVTAQGEIYCGAGERPFLTRLDCPVEVQAVSEKVLVAPPEARVGAVLMRLIPMSFRLAMSVTRFAQRWVVMATRSRVIQVSLAEGETLTVRREAVVAWTTRRPTGFCPKLRLRDVFLPRVRPTGLMMSFYGPGLLWLEGA